jgi:hypothetical protein
MGCADLEPQRLARGHSTVAAAERMENAVLPLMFAALDARASTVTAERELAVSRSVPLSPVLQQTTPNTQRQAVTSILLNAESTTLAAVLPIPATTSPTWTLAFPAVPAPLDVSMFLGSKALLKVLAT